MKLNRDQILNLAKKEPETLADYVLALQDQVSFLTDQFTALTGQVQQLTDEVAELKSRLNKNSQNSSKPPSSDGLKKPKPKSLRKKSNRKSGGQPGHIGHNLERIDHPDQTLVLPLNHCSCHHFLGDQPVINHECRQVFELPKPKLEVTEYKAEIKKCTGCGKIVTALFPENVTAPAQYGVNLKSFLLYLHHQHFIPAARISQLCEDLFGYSVSQGVLFAETKNCFSRLTDFETDLIERLRAELVLNVDETGFNVLVDGKWLHSASTEYLTFYGIHHNRGRKAMDDFGIIPEFRGTLVHDFYPSYLSYDCDHAFCNTHLLRELKFVHEERNQTWAKSLADLLIEMKHYVKEQRIITNHLSERKKKPWIHRYRKIISEGEKANPLIENQEIPKKRGRKKKTIEQNLLARFRTHENSILRFLHDLRVPFTNNLAEQDIRMMKVRQKISGCFRTFSGAQSFSRIRSYLSTCRKNKRDILSSITDALKGNATLEKITS